MDMNNYSYANNDSISRIIDGLDNDGLSITLAEEHDYFGEYYFSVSGYSYESGCIFETFYYKHFNPESRAKAYTKAVRLYNSFMPDEFKRSETLKQSASIGYREQFYIDRFRCIDTFKQITLNNIFVRGNLLYGYVDKFNVKTLAMNEICTIDYI